MKQIMPDYDSFDSFLALKNYLESHSLAIDFHIKSKKQYGTFIQSLLTELCKSYDFRQEFIASGGMMELSFDGQKVVKS